MILKYGGYYTVIVVILNVNRDILFIIKDEKQLIWKMMFYILLKKKLAN